MQPASLLVYIIIMKLKKIKLVVIAINLLQTTILSICQVFFWEPFMKNSPPTLTPWLNANFIGRNTFDKKNSACYFYFK